MGHNVNKDAVVLTAAMMLALVACARGLSCDESEPHVQKCAAPLNGYEYMSDNAVVPTMEPGALKEHCRHYDIFEKCMADIKPQCDRGSFLHYEGMEAFYQYLCHDGYDEYLQHRECFTKQGLQGGGDICNHTLSISRAELNKDNTSTSNYKRKRICQYMKQYLDCVQHTVETFCGAEAATWQRTLDTKTIQPTLDAIGCSLEPAPSYTYLEQHWKIITISALLSLSLLIVIISGAMLVSQKRHKRRRGTTNHLTTDDPPPYVGPSPCMVYNPAGQSVTPQGQAVPEKSNPETEPPPYAIVPETSIAQARDDPDVTSGDSAVAAGYFGVDTDTNLRAPKIDRDGLPKYQTLD